MGRGLYGVACSKDTPHFTPMQIVKIRAAAPAGKRDSRGGSQAVLTASETSDVKLEAVRWGCQFIWRHFEGLRLVASNYSRVKDGCGGPFGNSTWGRVVGDDIELVAACWAPGDLGAGVRSQAVI
jgi:hypothetical protein